MERGPMNRTNFACEAGPQSRKSSYAPASCKPRLLAGPSLRPGQRRIVGLVAAHPPLRLGNNRPSRHQCSRRLSGGFRRCPRRRTATPKPGGAHRCRIPRRFPHRRHPRRGGHSLHPSSSNPQPYAIPLRRRTRRSPATAFRRRIRRPHTPACRKRPSRASRASPAAHLPRPRQPLPAAGTMAPASRSPRRRPLPSHPERRQRRQYPSPRRESRPPAQSQPRRLRRNRTARRARLHRQSQSAKHGPACPGGSRSQSGSGNALLSLRACEKSLRASKKSCPRTPDPLTFHPSADRFFDRRCSMERAVSSVVERLLHTQEVAGSNPAPRTICLFLAAQVAAVRRAKPAKKNSNGSNAE